MTRHVGFALSTITAFLLTAGLVSAQAESHVRIVRLSYVDGQVQMEHADQGLDRAILNTPIVAGTRIVSRNDGLAEVEFEDQSALRLTGNSEVKFRQLSITDAGVKVNEIEVVRGVVFFDVRSKSEDVYRAVADGTTFLVRRDTVARISASPEQLQLAVLKGDVQLENQPQPVSVKKNETLTSDPSHPSEYKVAHGTEALPVDAWNKEREAYEAAYAHNSGYGGPRTGYGLQDLNYYGEYFYSPNYGYVWQPYGFANSMVDWNPYSNGAWGFVPGFGYSWASAYPWGWLPYHYGWWTFLSGGIGWAWVPGTYNGLWYANNFQPTPLVTNPPAGWTALSAPATPASTSPKPTILVGKAVGSPAYIPGGRIPPNFASVIEGRNVSPNVARGALVSSNARYNSTAKPTNPASALQFGHVFSPPGFASRSSGFNAASAWSGNGTSSGGLGSSVGHSSNGHGQSHH
jgi:FecR protein